MDQLHDAANPAMLHLVAPPAPPPLQLQLPLTVTIDDSGLHDMQQQLESELEKMRQAMQEASTQQQLADLTQRITVLAQQLENTNAKLSQAINALRTSVYLLLEAYNGHYHLIPAGMYTMHTDDSDVPLLAADAGMFQGPRGQFSPLGLQGTSGPHK